MREVRSDEFVVAVFRRGIEKTVRIVDGQLDVALAAYAEAISLAPDRALPHASLGQVLLRKGAGFEALAAFDTALVRAARDEASLRGRSEALALLGRRTIDAADALDLLADVQEAAGRLDARDVRRALDLAEQKARRRRLQDLTRRLRLAAGEEPAEGSLAGTLRPLRASKSGAEHHKSPTEQYVIESSR